MTNPRVMIVSQHFPPEIGAASNRVEHLSRHLQEKGFDVYVVTSQPGYPNHSLYERQPSRSIESGCKVYRMPYLSIGRRGVGSRLLQHFSFLLFATLFTLYIALRYRVKVCITTSPPFGVNLIGWLFLIGRNRKWLMEVRDLWPDSMIAVGAIDKHNLIYRGLKKIERCFYRAASKVIVVTSHTKGILITQGIHVDKIIVVTNGVPDWVIEDYPANDDMDNSDRFRILYVGNLGRSQNLIQLLGAAKELQHNSHIEFVIIGDGLEKQSLLEYTKQENLTNVHFIPAILDKQEILKWYKSADLGVVSLRQSELFQYVIPSKLFEYAAAGLPILYIGSGEGANLVTRYDLGKCVNFDKSLVALTILETYNLNKKIRLPKDSIERFQRDFGWEVLSEKYIETLNEVGRRKVSDYNA